MTLPWHTTILPSAENPMEFSGGTSDDFLWPNFSWHNATRICIGEAGTIFFLCLGLILYFFIFIFKFNCFYDWYLFNHFLFAKSELWSNSSKYIQQSYSVDMLHTSRSIPNRGYKPPDNYMAFLDCLEVDDMTFDLYDDHRQMHPSMIFVGTYVRLSAIVWWFIATCQSVWYNMVMSRPLWDIIPP